MRNTQSPTRFSKAEVQTREVTLIEESTQRADSYGISLWRPWTLGAGALVPFTLFTGGIIVALGLLQWQNSRNGAIFLTSDTNGFSTIQTFLYNFLPTIMVVSYGIFWNWIDLDYKRLEPWFQLSQQDGAKAEDSLLLRYPVEFLPVVPIKAARKRLVL